jgi:phospholipid/cholesterol/gamma-HCH transport system permease protein
MIEELPKIGAIDAVPDARRHSPATDASKVILPFGDAADYFWRIVRGGRRSGRHHFGEVLRQASILVTGSLAVVLAMAFSFGLVVGIQASYAGQLVGAPAAAGAFTAISDLREIVPYAFGYMMAAKVSTGYVAEIGTMGITDEIDALDVMGLDSLAYLCSTRLLATWLVLPFMYATAIVVCFAGSFIAVVLQIRQASSGGYFELFWKFQSLGDWVFSGAKGMLMGTFVVLVGCYFGYKVRGGPVEVGNATARAMVANLVGIHLIGIITSQLFWGGGPRLPIGG